MKRDQAVLEQQRERVVARGLAAVGQDQGERGEEVMVGPVGGRDPVVAVHQVVTMVVDTIVSRGGAGRRRDGHVQGRLGDREAGKVEEMIKKVGRNHLHRHELRRSPRGSLQSKEDDWHRECRHRQHRDAPQNCHPLANRTFVV